MNNCLFKPEFNEFITMFKSEIKRIDENTHSPCMETIKEIKMNQDKNKFWMDSKLENFQSTIESYTNLIKSIS